MKATYPLFDLISDDISPTVIQNGIVVSPNEIEIEKIVSINISEEDKRHLSNAKLCLSVDDEVFIPKQASIAFIISCRLHKRTKVFIRYKVDGLNRVAKVRDDYPFVTSDDVTSRIDHSEFGRISEIFRGLFTFKNLTTRTSNASYFLSLAYRSRKWLEALLFHVCALETLTSGTEMESGATDKFVRRIHTFVGYDLTDLQKIYDVRSELVHGRYEWDSEEKNLELCRIAEEVSRSVFIKILLDKSHLDSFRNDEARLSLFEP
jgi:hypothetical protein